MSKKKSAKRYVVRKGKKTGIFSTRAECEKSVSGYTGAQYKSFDSLFQAEKASENKYEDYMGKTTLNQSGHTGYEKESISVDAACMGNPGILEFRGVKTGSGQEIFSYGPYPQGTVNIGEFIALVMGIRYCIQHNIEIVYSDSRTAQARVRNKKINTMLTKTSQNNALFVLLEESLHRLQSHSIEKIDIRKRETDIRGEIPADYGRK